jgi:hypothetical protein
MALAVLASLLPMPEGADGGTDGGADGGGKASHAFMFTGAIW